MTPVVFWHPGTAVATADVASGLAYGLTQHGVELIPYATCAHLKVAGAVLMTAWRAGKKSQPRPTQADILYWASKGILDTALRAALTRGAEWVVVVSGMYQHPDLLPMLRRAGLKVCVVLTESPYDLLPEARYVSQCDLAFTNERSAVAALRDANPRTYYLPHAWHPAIHRFVAEAPCDVPAHHVVFVGTGFIERVRLLSAMRWDGIDFGLYGTWSLLGPRAHLRRHLRGGEIENTRAAALYQRATVGLNLHRTSKGYGHRVDHVAHAESMNPRCYELAACGRFFTTDARAEVHEVFGDTLPTFTTPADAEAIVRRALREPAWREDVAEACRQRVVTETWTQRAAHVLDVLGSYSRERAA
jgi:spore maturation protein CgeB